MIASFWLMAAIVKSQSGKVQVFFTLSFSTWTVLFIWPGGMELARRESPFKRINVQTEETHFAVLG